MTGTEPRIYVRTVIAAEVFAWGVEALRLKSFGVQRAMLWSFIANAASFCIGMALRKWIGVP